MGMSSAIIYNDYKAFIFPTLFYYNVSLYSTILLLSSGRSFEDNEFTYAIFRTRFIPPLKKYYWYLEDVCLPHGKEIFSQFSVQSAHPSIYLFILHMYMYLSSSTSIYPFHPPIYLFIHPSIHPFIHPSIHCSYFQYLGISYFYNVHQS